MSSLFFAGDKATSEEVRKTLSSHVVDHFDGAFSVQFETDDGGSHVCLYIEVDQPSKPLTPQMRSDLHRSKWLGWRYMLIKVPVGYVKAFFP